METLRDYLWATILITIPIVAVSLLWDGFVTMKLWEWFVLRTFDSAPPLHLASAIGLSILVGFVARSYVSLQQTDSMKAVKYAMSYMFVAPTLTLFGAWIVQFWV
jgi:hypothetical protein